LFKTPHRKNLKLKNKGIIMKKGYCALDPYIECNGDSTYCMYVMAAFEYSNLTNKECKNWREGKYKEKK
jgi:hypothetical protein